jgi:hypothetical protein
MYRLYLFMVCLLFTSVLPAQNLVEKYRSQPGQIWFNRSQLASRTQTASVNDYNQNGIPDIWTVDPQQSEWLEASEPVSTNPVLSDPSQNAIHSSTRFHLEEEVSRLLHGQGAAAGLDFSVLRVDNEGVAEVLLHPLDFALDSDTLAQSILLSLDVGNGTATELKRFDSVVGFFDVDGDELADLIQYLPETRQVVVYGLPRATPLQPDQDEQVAELRSDLAYEVALKFEGAEEQHLPYLEQALRSPDAWDLNGDSTSEIVLRLLDSLDRTRGIRVINGANGKARFSYAFPEDQPDLASSFQGFYDVDGENGKEIYLGERSVLDRNGEIYQLPEHFVTLGFMDIDGDNLPDIVGRDTARQRIQIYGRMTSTSVRDKLASALGLKVHPAYPNPVTSGQPFQLPLILAKASRLQITLHTIEGRQLKTIFASTLNAGKHTLQVDPGSLPRGVYVYRIGVGSGLIARQFFVQ